MFAPVLASGPVDRFDYLLAFVQLTCCNLRVQDDAPLVFDGDVLLVARFKPAVAPGGRHRGIRVSGADIFVFAGLTAALPLLVSGDTFARFTASTWQLASYPRKRFARISEAAMRTISPTAIRQVIEASAPEQQGFRAAECRMSGAGLMRNGTWQPPELRSFAHEPSVNRD